MFQSFNIVAFTTWLHRLTVNQVLMHFRKNHVRKEQLTALSCLALPQNMFGLSSKPFSNLVYFEAHTYLGSDSSDQIALANKVAGREPTRFSTWASENFPRQLNATDGAVL